jgi:serine/threonine-protein kinase HipA
MDRNGIWTLSPAYDVTFACDSGNKWLAAHQMTINGKKSNILINDMVACGQNIDIKTSKCKNIIEEVKDAVKEWKNIARAVGIREKTISLINKEINKNSAE